MALNAHALAVTNTRCDHVFFPLRQRLSVHLHVQLRPRVVPCTFHGHTVIVVVIALLTTRSIRRTFITRSGLSSAH
jgi:hypothetical protein